MSRREIILCLWPVWLALALFVASGVYCFVCAALQTIKDARRAREKRLVRLGRKAPAGVFDGHRHRWIVKWNGDVRYCYKCGLCQFAGTDYAGRKSWEWCTTDGGFKTSMLGIRRSFATYKIF